MTRVSRLATLAVAASAVTASCFPGEDGEPPLGGTCFAWPTFILISAERRAAVQEITGEGCDILCSCGGFTAGCPCEEEPGDIETKYAYPLGAGTCKIRIEFNDGTQPLEVERVYGHTSSCCDDACPLSGPHRICIGEMEDTAECDLVAP